MADVDTNFTAEPLVCKRCGRPHLDKDVSVSEDVLKEYTRCALGGIPFTKTFTILNGEITVTFEALPAEFEVSLGYITNSADSDMQALDIRLLMSLTEIRMFDRETSGLKVFYSADLDARRKMLENPKDARIELSSKVDAVLLGALRRMSATFVILQNAILEELVNKDFYEGVGLV